MALMLSGRGFASSLCTVWLVFLLAACGSEQIMIIEGDDKGSSTTDAPPLGEHGGWGIVELSDLNQVRLEGLLVATNEARAQPQVCGSFGPMASVAPLKRHALLDDAAVAHAEDMVDHNFISHEGSDGSDFTGRIARAYYPGLAMGENIAATYRAAEGVVQGWLDSEKHCKILMNPDATEVGFGVVDGDRLNDFEAYWVQVFGRQE
ncbi:MAG: CAP domain-containing protein [Bradymonadaceae bacterium]|nr:CAP domain-containing protein [Lujinxingiaceae bacterium]